MIFTGCLISRKPAGAEPLDGIPLVVGVSTILQQFNLTQRLSFLARICQYMNSILSSCTSASKEDVHDLSAVFFFINMFCRLNPQSNELLSWVKKFVPSYYILPTLINNMLSFQ